MPRNGISASFPLLALHVAAAVQMPSYQGFNSSCTMQQGKEIALAVKNERIKLATRQSAPAVDLQSLPDVTCETRILNALLPSIMESRSADLDSDLFLPSREFFPELLRARGLHGHVLEIGVGEGIYSTSFLSKWKEEKEYHGIDPRPKLKFLEKLDSRYHFHNGLDTEFTKVFPDGYFDLIYIDSVHNYAEVKRTVETWLPKLKSGGVLGGHDYCRAKTRGNEEGVETWPNPNLDTMAGAAEVPQCGVYSCIGYHYTSVVESMLETHQSRTIEAMCNRAKRSRAGKPKRGFIGVAMAAQEAAASIGANLHWTLEGRGNAGRITKEEVLNDPGYFNPSWWLIKPGN